MKLAKSFFDKSTTEIAKNLLGCKLIYGKTSGMIVETEAYLFDDKASHSFSGETKRNAPMFGKPGTVYIYFTYGMHFCFNVVTNKKGVGEAVLIRALEPVEGIEIMKKRRGTENLKNLCNGPAKLVQALGIKKEMNGASLLKGNLRIDRFRKIKEIVSTERIGISKGKELKLRFLAKNSSFTSGKVVPQKTI